ncbi:tyrosine aminotransferase-like [Halichoeres trimaculatus]|uniref:tyrosine aminotransferase-like n=1 Tax=Halichoeres trimaculatus TaxID=147232 RepID=UPI003D9F8525
MSGEQNQTESGETDSAYSWNLGALESIVNNTPQSCYNETISFLQSNSELCFHQLSLVPSLSPVMPSGAVYLMESPHYTKVQELKYLDLVISEALCLYPPGFSFTSGFQVHSDQPVWHQQPFHKEGNQSIKTVSSLLPPTDMKEVHHF